MDDRARRRPPRLPLVLLQVLALAGALAGCASFGGPGDPPVDQVWRVLELDGEALPRLEAGRAPTLQLERSPARASGFGGCNRVTGSYLLDGDGLSFGVLASTRMACEPKANVVEASYTQALQSVTHWRRRGGELELLDASGAVRMRLEKAGRIDAPPPVER